MSKLPTVTGEEAIGAFRKDGFELVAYRSRHHILKKDGHAQLLTVPVNAGKVLKPGTLRSLIRAAGLTVERFVELLNG